MNPNIRRIAVVNQRKSQCVDPHWLSFLYRTAPVRFDRTFALAQVKLTSLAADGFDDMCGFVSLCLLHGCETSGFGATANFDCFLSHLIFLFGKF